MRESQWKAQQHLKKLILSHFEDALGIFMHTQGCKLIGNSARKQSIKYFH